MKRERKLSFDEKVLSQFVCNDMVNKLIRTAKSSSEKVNIDNANVFEEERFSIFHLEASLWFPWKQTCLRGRQLEEEEEEAESENKRLRRKRR